MSKELKTILKEIKSMKIKDDYTKDIAALCSNVEAFPDDLIGSDSYENSPFHTQESVRNAYEVEPRRITQEQIYKIVMSEKKLRYSDECGGAFYLTEDKFCYFKKNSDREVENYIASLLNSSFRARVSKPCIQNVISALKREPDIKLKKNLNVEYFVNVKNGVLDVRSLELLPHDFSYCFDYCIDAEYVENATMEAVPSFKKYIESSLDGDRERVKKLLQANAFLLSNIPAKTAIFFLGAPDSGKSVVLKWLTLIYGKENVSNVQFHKLGNTFYLDKLSDVKLNISYELKNIKSDNLDIFKSLTGGGDALMAEKKGGEPYFFTAQSKLAFAGNVMPKIKEQELTEAFLNRVVILHFPVSIPKSKQDPQLVAKLADERSIIFSLSMRELPELCKSGFTFVEPKADRTYVQTFRQSMNNVTDFVKDRCQIQPNEKTWTLYESYCDYCSSNNLEVYSKAKFNDAFEAMPDLRRKKFRVGLSSPRYGYVGIRLKMVQELLCMDMSETAGNDISAMENESRPDEVTEGGER